MARYAWPWMVGVDVSRETHMAAEPTARAGGLATERGPRACRAGEAGRRGWTFHVKHTRPKVARRCRSGRVASIRPARAPGAWYVRLGRPGARYVRPGRRVTVGPRAYGD